MALRPRSGTIGCWLVQKPEGSTIKITYEDTSKRSRRQLLAAGSTEVTVVYTFGATKTGEDAAAAFLEKAEGGTLLTELKAVLPTALAEKMGNIKASQTNIATTPEFAGASSFAPSIVAATAALIAAMVL